MKAGLRRELGAVEAMALSIALMAPTLSASLNGAGIAAQVGQSVPLAIVVSAIGIGFVAYAFVRLTRIYNHAGSVYALSGMTLGPRAGFFGGFALLGVYLAFTGSTLTGAEIFGSQFLSGVGWWSHPQWLVLTLVLGGLGLAMACLDIKVASRILLSLEGISITLVMIVSVIVIIKSASSGSSTPTTAHPEHLTGTPFGFNGLGLGTLMGATVLGFFSWAGFEASASLGEETKRPRRYIPIAIAVSVVVGAVVFLVAMYAQIVGFGTTSAGIKAYAASTDPVAQITGRYVAGSLGNVLNLGAFFSAFGALLATCAAAGRMLLALARDGFGPPVFAKTWARTGTPAYGVIGAVIVGLFGIICFRGIDGAGESSTYFYLGTIGSLALIVAYAMTSAGAIRLVIRQAGRLWYLETATLALGVGFLGYVLYKSVVPSPSGVAAALPYIVLGWILFGLIVVLASPKLARRIGDGLTKAEGFKPGELPLPDEVSPDIEPAVGVES